MKKISVLITAYNSAQYIQDALKSIISQSLQEFQVIVVDDGSIDSTYDIITEFNDDKLRYYPIEHRGRSYALNYGISKSEGEYIAIMDADDIAHPDRLNIQFNFLEKNPRCSLVGTYAELIDEKGNYISTLIRPLSSQKVYRNLFSMNSISFPTIMFKKHIALEKPFNDKLNVSEDLDWFVKVLPNYKAVNIPKKLMKLRQTVGSRSRKEKIDYSFFVKTVEVTIKKKLLTDKADYKFIDYLHLGCLHYYYGDLAYAKYYLIEAFKIRKVDSLLWRYLTPLFFPNVKKLKKNRTAKNLAGLFRRLQNL